jgi:hypothetical protein
VENTVRFVRERFWKGETFIDVDDVWRRSQHWCREVAGRRVHGTTQRIPVEVFEAEERAALTPFEGGRFDTPQWGQSKVHPDCHIRFGKSFYSVPERWRGCSMDVRADRSLVRIYNRGELIKTHPRLEPGRKSTDIADYPDHKAPYAMRCGRTSTARRRAIWVNRLAFSRMPCWVGSFRGVACGRPRNYCGWLNAMGPSDSTEPAHERCDSNRSMCAASSGFCNKPSKRMRLRRLSSDIRRNCR